MLLEKTQNLFDVLPLLSLRRGRLTQPDTIPLLWDSVRYPKLPLYGVFTVQVQNTTSRT
jgi:hypothetical protein